MFEQVCVCQTCLASIVAAQCGNYLIHLQCIQYGLYEYRSNDTYMPWPIGQNGTNSTAYTNL